MADGLVGPASRRSSYSVPQTTIQNYRNPMVGQRHLAEPKSPARLSKGPQAPGTIQNFRQDTWLLRPAGRRSHRNNQQPIKFSDNLFTVWWDRRPAGLLIQSPRSKYKMTGGQMIGTGHLTEPKSPARLSKGPQTPWRNGQVSRDNP